MAFDPRWPVNLMTGDSLSLNGAPAFTVGRDIVFNSEAEVLTFVATADRREIIYIETTVPSIFRLLFGGKVESRVVRETRYFKKGAR